MIRLSYYKLNNPPFLNSTFSDSSCTIDYMMNKSDLVSSVSKKISHIWHITESLKTWFMNKLTTGRITGEKLCKFTHFKMAVAMLFINGTQFENGNFFFAQRQ